MKLKSIETNRLELIRVTPKEYTEVFEQYSKEEVMRLFCIDEATYQSELENIKLGKETHVTSFVYFYLKHKINKEVFGWCSYHVWYLRHNRAEIGYVLYKDEYKNQGYISEALETVIPYGFNEMKLHRIEAFVGVQNEVSLKVMKKFKFNQEGCLKQHYLRDGVYEDSLAFGLLVDEY